jgi:hypothetical protein
MNDREQDQAVVTYASWSEDDLVKAVTVDRDKYRSEVLPLIEHEIKKRGLNNLSLPPVAAVAPSPDSATKHLLLKAFIIWSGKPCVRWLVLFPLWLLVLTFIGAGLESYMIGNVIFAWACLLVGAGLGACWTRIAPALRWPFLAPLVLLILVLALPPIHEANKVIGEFLALVLWVGILWLFRKLVNGLGKFVVRIFDVLVFWPWIVCAAMSPFLSGNAGSGFTVAGSEILGGLVFGYGMLFGLFLGPVLMITVPAAILIRALRTARNRAKIQH